jgi:hypothetical protein
VVNELALLAVVACPVCARGGGAPSWALQLATLGMLAGPVVIVLLGAWYLRGLE